LTLAPNIADTAATYTAGVNRRQVNFIKSISDVLAIKSRYRKFLGCGADTHEC